MNQTKYHYYYEDLCVQIVELMYEGNEYCMGFILPKRFTDLNNCSSYLNKPHVQKSSKIKFLMT